MRIGPTDGYSCFYFRFKGKGSPHYLIFHVQNHKTVCIFSLLPQKAYLRRNMNYGALLRPPRNIKAFLFSLKTPYNKTDVSVFIFFLPILN